MRFSSKKRTYLDWAAAAPVSKKAWKAYEEGQRYFGNPGALHSDGRKAKELLEKARVRIARLAQVKSSGVIFTSGATEANALGILGSVRARIHEGTPAKNIHVLYHPGAHSSVIGSVEMLEAKGVHIEPLQLMNGEVDVVALSKQITTDTVLIALEAVSGETGTIFDVRNVRRCIDAHTRGTSQKILLHIDASQAPYVRSYALPELGADLLTLDAQKVGAVRGMGVLLVAGHVPLTPLMKGGGQESGRRPGTENPALAHSFATALEECHRARTTTQVIQEKQRAELLSALEETPRVLRNETRHQASHIVNVSVLGRDTDYLVMLLDARGHSVSTKSSCESDSADSRMVRLLTNDEARARSTLRISWGQTTTHGELKRFAKAFARAVRFLDDNPIY